MSDVSNSNNEKRVLMLQDICMKMSFNTCFFFAKVLMECCQWYVSYGLWEEIQVGSVVAQVEKCMGV